MKKIVSYFGLAVITLSVAAMRLHRFTMPDITEARWMIDYWFVLALGLLGITVGAVIYLVCSKESKTSG